MPSSPLYSQFSRSIAEDSDLLSLAGHCRADQPAPLFFFAAIHFLLLQGVHHTLANHYPSLHDENHPASEAFTPFREFCLENRESLIPILETGRVQTNEVGRSAFLCPAFSYISELVNGRPIALVEIGASTGLNLNWDKYSYAYGEQDLQGNPQSPVKLESAIKGSKLPPTPENFPEIASRLGLELHPIVLENDEERLWLEALIWPEHRDRIGLLRGAIDMWKAQPQGIIVGDAVETLPAVLAGIPHQTLVVIFHSLALYQFSREQEEEFMGILADNAKERSLFHLSAEWDGVKQLAILLTDCANARSIHLENSEAHGRWLEWLVD